MSSSNSRVLIFIALFAMVALALPKLVRRGEAFVPRPLPMFAVDGWINAEEGEPTADRLKGELVVVEGWATWCGPCRAELPSLVAFHEEFKDRVQLVSLTRESGEEAETVKELVAATPGWNWPVGYGANLPLDQLENRYLPTFYLFTRQGVSVWQGHSVEELKDAVVGELARE